MTYTAGQTIDAATAARLNALNTEPSPELLCLIGDQLMAYNHANPTNPGPRFVIYSTDSGYDDIAAHVIGAYRRHLALTQDAHRPTIVCLCGSTRFYDAFQQANYDETMAGRIVLTVGFYPHAKAEHGHGEGVGHDSDKKVALDELHKRKIDLADEILILNVGGYIGDSTRSEIEYARAHGKRVRWLETHNIPAEYTASGTFARPSYRAFLGENPCSDPSCPCHPQPAPAGAASSPKES